MKKARKSIFEIEALYREEIRRNGTSFLESRPYAELKSAVVAFGVMYPARRTKKELISTLKNYFE